MSEQQQTNKIPEELTQQQAIGLLIQGVELGQSRGAYNLNEAALIAKAKRAFQTDEQETTKQVPETTETIQTETISSE